MGAPVAAKAKQTAFLAAYAEVGNVTAAARMAKVSRQAHYNWLGDPEYADKFAAASEEAVDSLEAEARRRAVQGNVEPVFQGGKQVGEIRKFSDTLLIFLLKGARPERYRERYDVRQEVVTVDAIDAEIARLEAELAARAGSHPAPAEEGTSPPG